MPKKKNEQKEPENPPGEQQQQPEAKEVFSSTKCMVPNCVRERKTRGLCSSCYQSALKLVKDGRTTWKGLEDAGKCLKASHAGRGSSKKQEWFLS